MDRDVHQGDFSVVQWLRLHAPSAGGPDSIPGLGIRSCMPQLSVNMLKIPCAATKTRKSQKKKRCPLTCEAL